MSVMCLSVEESADFSGGVLIGYVVCVQGKLVLVQSVEKVQSHTTNSAGHGLTWTDPYN